MMRTVFGSLQRDRWTSDGEQVTYRLRAIKSEEIRMQAAHEIQLILQNAEKQDQQVQIIRAPDATEYVEIVSISTELQTFKACVPGGREAVHAGS